MTITPSNIFDWRDRELRVPKGCITFRLYSDGWLVRFTPFDASLPTAKIEAADVFNACYFANERLS
jgi:hypothetical protein